MKYHKPVLLKKSIRSLITNTDGVYVDTTFGGGGHSKEILNCISEKGKLFSFDCDKDVIKNLIDDRRFQFINSNFTYLKKDLNLNGIFSVDGIIADFGISSHQIDTPSRGFSIRFNGPLDMRMNQQDKINAFDIVNNYSERKLKLLFKTYGEITQVGKLVSVIISNRKISPITTTRDLINIIKPLTPSRFFRKYASKVFQAIRIEVNNELDSIQKLLSQSVKILRDKGRIVCITYHSLEDRLVKNFFKNGVFDKNPQTDFFGNKKNSLRTIGKFLVPNQDELKDNSRSRSAKLRIAEKI